METTQADKSPWYAVRTLHCKEEGVSAYFQGEGLPCFIPQLFREVAGAGGKPVRKQVPAIHNLLFVQSGDLHVLSGLCRSCPFPAYLVCLPGSSLPCAIPAKEMAEFRAVCDPSYQGTLYVPAALAEAKPGQPVRVVRGAFAGLSGKLVRHKGRYYVVIVCATLGVMVHVPKWYCEAVGPEA